MGSAAVRFRTSPEGLDCSGECGTAELVPRLRSGKFLPRLWNRSRAVHVQRLWRARRQDIATPDSACYRPLVSGCPMTRPIRIAPSILSADFARLGEEVRAVDSAGADWIHVDVMDGHFVPNITIGPPVVASLRAITKLPLDVHLMIEHPEKYIADFARAGADYLTIHIETVKDPNKIADEIRKFGAKPGITLRPATPESAIEHVI